MEMLHRVYWNNSVQEWVAAAVILLCFFIGAKIFKNIVVRYTRKFVEHTNTAWDDFLLLHIERALLPIAVVAGTYFAIASLVLPTKLSRILDAALLVAGTYFVVRFILSVVSEFIHSFTRKGKNGQAKEKQATGLIIVINITVWILGAVFLLDNFGYDVTTIVTGLGIGGITIALAAQTILRDLFSYFVIFFDRPFEIGDFIIVDDKMGTVEYVGVKTTRIRTLSGEQLVCSNTDLTNSRLHNYKRMEKRRVVFKIGVLYQTSHEKLRQIPGWLKYIIESKPDVSYDRGHFASFGASSLDFEFVYYVDGADYNIYMDRQQSIYLDIVRLFEEEKIEFAYPTQTLFVNSVQAFADVSKS